MIRKNLLWETGMGLKINRLGVHGRPKTFKMGQEGKG